jgi:hypothetical protein
VPGYALGGGPIRGACWQRHGNTGARLATVDVIARDSVGTMLDSRQMIVKVLPADDVLTGQRSTEETG